MKAIITALALTTLLAGPTAEATGQVGARTAVVHAASLGPVALPEGRIERIVYGEGFAEISSMELRRDRYLIEAVQPSGAVFLLTLDAGDGAVITSERRGWARASSAGPPLHRRPGAEFRFDF